MTSPETAPSADKSTGQLMVQLSEQTSRLVRDELELARLELKEAAKHAGVGAGLFSAAGLLGLFGFASLIATTVIALDLALPLWASALIVTVAILLAAGIAALFGKKQVQQASPKPERTVESVKLDVHELKEGHHGNAQ